METLLDVNNTAIFNFNDCSIRYDVLAPNTDYIAKIGSSVFIVKKDDPYSVTVFLSEADNLDVEEINGSACYLDTSYNVASFGELKEVLISAYENFHGNM